MTAVEVQSATSLVTDIRDWAEDFLTDIAAEAAAAGEHDARFEMLGALFAVVSDVFTAAGQFLRRRDLEDAALGDWMTDDLSAGWEQVRRGGREIDDHSARISDLKALAQAIQTMVRAEIEIVWEDLAGSDAEPDDRDGAPGGPGAPAYSSPWVHAHYAFRIKSLDIGPPLQGDNAEAEATHVVRQILFGTNRRPDPAAAGGFGSERDQLRVGTAEVSVPLNRSRGSIPRPWRVVRWSGEEDAAKHIMLASDPKVLDEAAFLKLVAEASDPSSAFLFIHGYNTPFAGGLYRTAQLATDLEITGPVFHFSWPSRGQLLAYDYDDASADGARDVLLDFLNLIVKQAGVLKLNIIAHSKGNDLLLNTLRLAAAAGWTTGGGQLVLASPDVDEDVATGLIPKIAGLFGGVTLYANDYDRPLLVSRFKAGGVPRAGGLLADGAPLIAQGADSIDANDANFDWFGLNHDAYVAAPQLMFDILALFERGVRPPDQRTPALRPQQCPRGQYWRLVTS